MTAVALAAAPLRAQGAFTVEIIGHRGAAGLAPENTRASFARACEVGVSGIEFDVHLSADRAVVVHHDYALHPDIARDSNGRWIADDHRPLIREITLAELRRYDVGRLRPTSDYAARYPDQAPSDGENIPTLDEVITQFIARCAPPTRLVVEIKSDPTKPELSFAPESVVDRTVAQLRARGVLSRAQFISFDWRAIQRVQQIAPDIPTSYLTIESRDFNTIDRGVAGASPWMGGIDVDAHAGSVPRAIKASGGGAWSPHFRNLTAESLAEAHALGLKVYPWTVNVPADMERLLALGVDGITTDRPDVLRTVVATRLPGDVHVRAMSFNIAAGAGDLDAIAAVIRASSADVIALQEVDVHWSARSNFADQATRLGELLGMHVRFAPIYRNPSGDSLRPMREFGVALLSAHPIKAFINRPLSRLSTQQESSITTLMPGLLDATVNVSGVRLRVMNTHLDYRADPAVRRQQVDEMLAVIADAHEPLVLFGDLNAPPYAPELAPLFSRLRDAWRGRSDAGFTYPALAPAKRIDYVLTSSGIRVIAASVLDTRASDHRPVIADLVLPGSPR